jgi:ubiquinone/menaquinone biosynthesis C-methylase UbiE
MADERLIPQTGPWYDRLATLQEGYVYPWRSSLGEWDGEDAYLALVHRHLRPDLDVLDVACGHGEVACEIAPQVRSVLAYDRTAAWIELGRRRAQEQGLGNLTFVCHDSSLEANGGRARIPAEDGSFDLLICSKGPFHWLEDARRVARPGATLLMLVPSDTPVTPWHSWLPVALQWRDRADPHWAQPAVERRLEIGRLTLDSWWSFEVPEVFPEPSELYAWLTWGMVPGEVPAYEEVRAVLERVFAEHGGRYRTVDGLAEGVAIRRRRYLWKAVVPD